MSWLFSLVLGLALAYAGGAWMGYVAGPVGRSSDAAPKALQAAPAQGRDTAVILERNILDLELPKPPEAENQAPPVPPDMDPAAWKVLGTMVGSRSMAIVVAKDATEYLFQGEYLHGWQLSGVDTHSVTWTRDGETRTVASAVAADVDLLGAPLEPAAPKVELKEHKTVKVSFPKAKAEQILSQPTLLLQQALFKPYMYFGKVKGFQITNIQPGSILKDMGLVNGDVLLRINGVLIDGPQTLMQLYAGFSRSETISIDIERGGSVHSLLVAIN